MPDVNTIIVIGAERFGVSTLYQLKGRVGRSDQQAYAFFFVTSEESMTNATMFRMELIKVIHCN
jgi:transcription-repair coupling factor (superfamily II helicase)